MFFVLSSWHSQCDSLMTVCALVWLHSDKMLLLISRQVFLVDDYLTAIGQDWGARFVASRSQRVSLIVIPFCLSVWMSVGHSATYSLPRLIDHNQIWSAGVYLSSDPCKPFWIPISHTFGDRGKICKISPISNGSPLTRILATANVTHRAVWLVFIGCHFMSYC